VRHAPAAVTALLLALGGPIPSGAATPPRVLADLSPDPVGLDELATLTLRVDSEGFRVADLDPTFDLDNLRVASGPFRSQSQSWVNGATSSSVQLVWRLQPEAVGTARVFHLRVGVAGGEQSLPDQTIRVVESAPAGRPPGRREAPSDPFSGLFDEDPFGIFGRPSAQPAAATPKVRVRALAVPLEAYVGQQIDWQLLLDTQTDISGVRPREMPDFRGFLAREVTRPNPNRPRWIDVDGERFGRVVVMERLLDPLREGEYSFDPVHVDVVARVAEVGWFGRLGRDQPLLLQTQPLRLRILPLPQPQPAGFSGLVGALALDARLSADHVAAGGVVHLVLTASGPAHLQGSEPPALALPVGLRAFPPANDAKTELDDGGWTTRVSWDFVVTADRPGSYELPSVRIGYFDPGSRTYREASSGPLALTVTAAAAAVETARMSPQAEPLPESNGSTPQRNGPAGWRASEPLMMAATAAVILLGVAIGIGVRARRRGGAGPARRALLANLAAARVESSNRLAATAIETAWRTFLAERYSLGRSVPVSQWPRWLTEQGLAETAARALVELFDDLHMLEFAPELSDRAALRLEVERRAQDLARRLR